LSAVQTCSHTFYVSANTSSTTCCRFNMQIPLNTSRHSLLKGHKHYDSLRGSCTATLRGYSVEFVCSTNVLSHDRCITEDLIYHMLLISTADYPHKHCLAASFKGHKRYGSLSGRCTATIRRYSVDIFRSANVFSYAPCIAEDLIYHFL
jgi:hypothetical protein